MLDALQLDARAAVDGSKPRHATKISGTRRPTMRDQGGPDDDSTRLNALTWEHTEHKDRS